MKPLIFLLTSLTIFLLPTISSAQNPSKGTYSGKVIEYGTDAPLEFINVAIFDTLSKQLVGGAISNIQGEYSVTNLPFNRPLRATYSSMGFSSQQGKVFRLTASGNRVNAPVIVMRTAAQLLDAVTVTGQRRTIEYSLDKKVVNVEQSLVSEGGSAVDVLQNVPSVSVDEEGNISMKGSESVTILIDGRPATLSGLGLDQIAANNIANIEIISNPSVKYNPEGTAGIVNIITKERVRSGFNGNVYASGSTSNRYGLGTNLSFGFKKVTLFTNIDMSYRDRGSNGLGYRTSFRPASSLFPDDNTSVEISASERKRQGYGGKFQLGADFYISPKTSLLISGTFDGWYNSRSNITPYSSIYSYLDPEPGSAYDPDMDIDKHWIQTLSTSTIDKENMYNGQGAISFKQKFDKPRQELTFDASVDYHAPKENSVSRRIMMTPEDTSRTVQVSDNLRKGINSEAQINYYHPINEKLAFEVGYQGKLQWQNTFSTYDTRLNLYQDTSIQFNYLEHNHGIYANFMGTYGKFTFQVGGRMEAALMDADKITDRGDTSFNYTHFRFYPAVHLSYKLGEKQELQLSYSRRVNRPRPHQLDPYVDYSDYPSSISYGNPNLSPQDIHSLELNYSLFLKTSSFYVSAYYRHERDLIRRYQFEAPDPFTGESILNGTFMNYAKGNTYGLDLSWEQQLTKWWRLSLNGSLYQTLTSDEVLSESLGAQGLSYQARLNTTMNLPLDFTLQLSCRYRGPSYWGQTMFDHNVSGELAVRKAFFKRRLNIGLRVSDLFHTQQWNSNTLGEGFISERKSKPKNSTALYVTINYKINQGASDQKNGPSRRH